MDVIDKLILLARGDLELLHVAIGRASVNGCADLERVVAEVVAALSQASRGQTEEGA